MYVHVIDSTATYCMWALIVLLVYELEAGIQYSDSTTAGQRLTTSTASVQDLPSDNIPSAKPSLSGSTAPTILITDTGYCNTKIETNPAQS